ncbi:hypothetical protein SAMN04489740_3322 [Arthrobacter alpinus]|uniref:Uncharacterized protein n=1 Tax=Arthrobacter alpinus TaxID=656366 RepID=A0A1H5N245_9MICC|nr:hypothetical protein [Arthrobacter alpinus]SEE95665.1 hypothetical protein SAMN04489740_3322 [Arthrobacter alpinus]
MSHPSPDSSEIQPSAPPSSQSTGKKPVSLQLPAEALNFKFPGGVLLTILGVLESLGSFAQVLTNILFAPWYLLLLSMLGLAIAVTVAGAGILMLLRRGMLEGFTPKLGVASTGALLATKLLTQVVLSGEFFGFLVPVCLAIAVFIVVGRGMLKTRDLV